MSGAMPEGSGGPPRDFRDYGASSDGVREFYREQHRRQTLAFVLAKKREYLRLDRRRMGVWEALEWLDTLVDESDPDTGLSQLGHLVQTAEALRRAGQPPWLVLTGLVHDLGKLLCLFGEPQWAVVGDTFPVGCRFSEAVVFPESFAENPDSRVPEYQTPTGIYAGGAGLARVHMSWGHDEYLYHVLEEHLPEEALYVIRYHSFYAQHQHGAYDHLLSDHDRRMFRWVKAFQPFDLYSKGEGAPDLARLVPEYRERVAEAFPKPLAW